MNNKVMLRILVGLLVLVSVLGATQAASANVGGTEPFYVWDRTGMVFNHSVADIYWDGGFVDVFSQLAFTDTNAGDLYTIQASDFPTYCSPGDQTYYAGHVLLEFDHHDANPAGALGMKKSQGWTLVDCDFDGSGVIDAADLSVDLQANPPTPYTNGDFVLLDIDQIVPAGGAVQDKIVTTMYLNLDTNCDNSLADESLPTGGVVCFYAQGVTPTIAEGGPPYWNNANLQATFEAGGAKTVNMKVFGPTAITLDQLIAQSPGGVHPAVWLAIFILLTAIGIVLIRESRQQKANRFIRHDD